MVPIGTMRQIKNQWPVCRFSIRFQLMNPYKSLTRNITKQMIGPLHKTMKAVHQSNKKL